MDKLFSGFQKFTKSWHIFNLIGRNIYITNVWLLLFPKVDNSTVLPIVLKKSYVYQTGVDNTSYFNIVGTLKSADLYCPPWWWNVKSMILWTHLHYIIMPHNLLSHHSLIVGILLIPQKCSIFRKRKEKKWKQNVIMFSEKSTFISFFSMKYNKSTVIQNVQW